MQYIVLGIVLIAAVLGLAIFFGSKSEEPASNAPAVPTQAEARKAPAFALNNYAGEEVALADFTSKNVIVNAWAAWCPFCVEELKDFAQLREEFADKISIIAIDRAESLDTAKSYTDDVGVTDRLILLLDPNDSFYRSIGGFSMPETIFVNGAGEIVFHKRGPMKLEEMREKAQQFFEI